MEGLIRPLYELEKFNLILKTLKNNKVPLMISGIFESQKAHLVSGILAELSWPSVFITYNELSARKIYEDLKLFFNDRVLYYPSKELIPYNIEAESLSLTESRLDVLDKLMSKKKYIVVLSIEALQNKIISPEIFKSKILNLSVGEKHQINVLSDFFTSVGYQHAHMVESKGQFSVRGEIIDFFPINENNPIRIDFFDEEIDSIKSFNVLSQRSISNKRQVKILPAKELFFDKEISKTAIAGIKNDLQKSRNLSNQKYITKLESKIMRDIEKIENGVNFAGIDKYFSYFYDDANLLDYLPKNSLVFIDEYNKIEKSANANFTQFSEIVKDGIEKGNILPQCINSIFQFTTSLSRIRTDKIIHLSTFLQNASTFKPVTTYNISSKPTPSFNGNIDLLIDDIKSWKQNKKRIIILAGTKAKCEKLSQVFKENGIDNHISEKLKRAPKHGEVIIANGSLNKGFEYSLINFVVVSDKEILGETKKKRKRTKKIGQKIKTFRELNRGDFVVHHIHGIGKYLGIEKLKVEGIIKDYFKIKYQKGDLFVPVSQLDLIQKYIGSEARQPKINKLGGADWKKVKSKVKASVQDLAKKLIRLYAEREMLKGFSFPNDSVWQRQFEETFPYDETSDQLQCIKEVKKDMQKQKPMDRLLCGDVGYGKTEVAIRAAFKSVMGGKQVAYLVPTTILAQQQFNTFEQRMRDFPVNVEMLSRFRTAKQQKEIIKKIKEGLVDIIIGTHRILSKDMQFKDLGLIIVDEEQRFGVTHKEKLKSLKKNVDVLTLTATPIPRTLHMALVGVRDMSVIEEPPEERYPVQTYVLEHDDEILKDAIIKELGRGGQVFYLHNRVSTIHKVAAMVKRLVPEARIVYAHGKMNKSDLEDIISSFLDGEFDVLVCTTIIETGIDMPNVNTIIIEDADKMGLAQLYQLRGRVGRSNRQAYAYFTFRKDKVLTEEAEKRLKAIKDFTEFGSGFKIAMRDLEIRGAGNIIGPEQHGHMNSVGYEMYCKILEDTIRELKGEKVEEKIETSIDINVSSYIDDKYINDSLQKINMYKKIASIQTEEDSVDIRDELMDRYGEIPIAVNNLIEIAYIKSLCTTLKISNVTQKKDSITFTFNEPNSIDLKVIGEISNVFKRRILFTASNTPYITFKTKDIPQNKLLGNIKILLQNLNNLQHK